MAIVSRDRNSDDEKGVVNPQIFRIKSDGSGRRQLVFSEAIDYNPVWSDNGNEIAFLRKKVAMAFITSIHQSNDEV